MSEETRLKEFPCASCGAKLQYEPGTRSQKCAHCGVQVSIPQSEEDVRELDFDAHFEGAAAEKSTVEQLTVKCKACAAESSLEPNVVSAVCPFCGSPIVAEGSSKKAIRPNAVLPFKITAQQAQQAFRTWLDGLWFVPGDLKKFARDETRMTGVYLPFWTYDASTTTFYRGERGDDYTETETYQDTETYTETNSQGQTETKTRMVTKTRQVTKTRWTSASGTVWDKFDDLLVPAGGSLPQAQLQKLEPWDLKNLVAYTDDYLAGFRAESYRVSLPEGFAVARQMMETTIESSICSDIGGDHQRIDSKKTQYDNVTFKHILLPVYLSAYRYRDKVFQFMVNARTGEVQGERPWGCGTTLMVVLIVAAVAALLAILACSA
jgi:LSD1 subclass zinc finger protein